MVVTAITRNARISPSKARDLVKRMRGLTVGDALQIADFSPRKGAFLVGKTLKSAIANAEHNAKLAVDALRVKEAVVETGMHMRRFWPRARGSASPIKKRTCHIRIVLTDGRDE